ncbi:MAG: hypothetical protein DMG05_13040 [Acidobacteria bacterium]|nr:MAG: hypothetical protein DMG05_13040 [Acidobacteriota bacterium]
MQGTQTKASARVSIVMPTYNRAHFLKKTIESVLSQSWSGFDLLVRDDCSTDDTEKVVCGIQDHRIHYYRNAQRLKMPDNLNEGIRACDGDYILVCHDHDLYAPSMVAQMVEFLNTHPTALFVHCGIAMIKEDGIPTGRQYIGNYPLLAHGPSWLSFMLGRFDCPVCANSMVRRSAYEQHGLYDPAFGLLADVEMWMRLSLHGDVGYIPQPLIQVRAREQDHEYSGINWTVVDIVLRIQRLYHEHAFTGWYRWWRWMRLEARAERYVLAQYLVSICKKDRRAHEEGRRYLKNSGMLLSRIIAWGL